MYKRMFFVLLAFGFASPACAQNVAEYWSGQANSREIHARKSVGAPMRLSGAVPQMIARYVAATIGQRWEHAALRIAKIESGFRCNARNGRAVGVFQNIDPGRFGVSRSAALTCDGGIRAGVAHMAMCIREGAASEAMLMRCHNSGSPWGRVDRTYRIALRG